MRMLKDTNRYFSSYCTAFVCRHASKETDKKLFLKEILVNPVGNNFFYGDSFLTDP